MAKSQPPDTKGHQLFLPKELDQKLKLLAPYGTVDDFIIKCVREGLEPYWREYITQEYASLNSGDSIESRQRPVRRSSQSDAKKASAENLRPTRKESA
jgi:hypothetical protein